MFFRYGRVNYVLARRLELLREVGRLQESLDVPGDVSYTCETAGHFYLYQVSTGGMCGFCVCHFPVQGGHTFPDESLIPDILTCKNGE